MPLSTDAETQPPLPVSEPETSFSSEEESGTDHDINVHINPEQDKTTASCYHDGEGESNPPPFLKRSKSDEQESYRQCATSRVTQTDEHTVPPTLRFRPARKPGPKLSSADSHSPASLFKLFFSESAVTTLCHNTNAQAAMATAKGHKYKWADVNVGEMYRYVGLIFYMALVKLPSITDYWRQSGIFSVPFPAMVMTRDRYRSISWNVHMSDPDADKKNDRKKGTPAHDALFRVKPLMDTIRHGCKAVYHPRRNVAVDERTTQYTKAKPSGRGFKLFVLVDSSNGYTADFTVCTRKNNVPTGPGASYHAVASLLDGQALGSGYCVDMDTSYTSPRLIKHLHSMKFVVCVKDSPGNVDLSEELLKYFATQHKSMTWYRKLFLHFLDISATNAFIVHKELYGNLSHKDFMEQLITQLCGVSHRVAPKRAGSDHVPVPGAELTSDTRKAATVGRRSCVLCKALHAKNKLTPWKCQECNVYLCLQLNRNCFQDWHRDVTVHKV